MRVNVDALLAVFGQYGLTEDHLNEVRREAVAECMAIFDYSLASAGVPPEYVLKMSKACATIAALGASEAAEAAIKKMKEPK